MASHIEYIEYICEKLKPFGHVRYQKMFGEYMIYLNQKNILMVCDDTLFMKQKEEVYHLMEHASTGKPYPNAKSHYILDIDDQKLLEAVIPILESLAPHKKIK